MKLHHFAIQVPELDNTTKWYCDFFQMEHQWTLDKLNHVTLSRLPGIRAVSELGNSNMRVHLLHMPGTAPAQREKRIEFQHICMQLNTAEDVQTMHAKWISFYNSGKYGFQHDWQPTEIIDEDGAKTFYCFDVHGNEFELTYIP